MFSISRQALYKSTAILFLVSLANAVLADDKFDHKDELDADNKLTVYGREEKQLGEDISASQGSISKEDIQQRPVLRTGEILEFVPGMVATQHSGSGKANQYFLRGFNLDHGTDFSSSIDGMPINMRTHGHGQGYTDLNFIVPEFIKRIDYQKGPYHAEIGDFSTAGSAYFLLADMFSKSMIQLEFGENSFLRSVVAHQLKIKGDNLLLGLETHQYDGPWSDINEDVKKNNMLLRYVTVKDDNQLSLTFLGYDNTWNSADQIPQRAISNGLIDSLGSLDTDVGGESSRHSFSANYKNDTWVLSAYVIESSLELFSNFTYFLDDPINGDEFEQVDKRQVIGGELIKHFTSHFSDNHFHHRLGFQYRFDDIDTVGLYKTVQRQRISTVREDSVDQYSMSLFWDGDFDLTERLSSYFGIRYDFLDVDVNSDNPLNSGTADDNLLSLKAGFKYQISDDFYSYFNIGQSFHSNDARGATISVDPVSGDSVDPVDLLVRGEGAELGLHYWEADRYNLSVSLWYLDLDSELLFVGDAGTTEPARASQRQGIEVAGYYWLDKNFSTDIELAWSRARFTHPESGEGRQVDGTLPFVASIGMAWIPVEDWRLSVRARHFGKRPLDSFAEQESDSFSVVNFAITASFEQWQFDLKLLNLLDSDDHDIDYYYASRLPGEIAQGIEDNHFHPIEPRTLRLQMRYVF